MKAQSKKHRPEFYWSVAAVVEAEGVSTDGELEVSNPGDFGASESDEGIHSTSECGSDMEDDDESGQEFCD